MSFTYSAREDYDGGLKINRREIRCYSAAYMKRTYPDGNYELAGEISRENHKKTPDDLTLARRRFSVSPEGHHSRLLYRAAGYVRLADGRYVAVLKSRKAIWFALLLAVIAAAGALILLRGRTEIGNDGASSVIPPDYSLAEAEPYAVPAEEEPADEMPADDTPDIVRVLLPEGTVAFAAAPDGLPEGEADLDLFITTDSGEQSLFSGAVVFENGAMRNTVLDFETLCFEVLPGEYSGRAVIRQKGETVSERSVIVEVVSNSGGSMGIGFSPEVTIDLATGAITMLYQQAGNSTHDTILQLILDAGDAEYLLAESGVLNGAVELTAMTLRDEMKSRLTEGVYTGRLRLNFYNDTESDVVLNTDINVSITVR